MTKTVVVANPQSAAGSLGRRWSTVEAALRRAIPELTVKQTTGPRDATRLTREALRGGADLVVAVGGDGTIHEVANGFFEDGKPVRAEAAMGVLPFGTGGDFRKTAGIPTGLDEAAAVLAAGHRRVIDVGILEYRKDTHNGPKESCVFVNIASFGASGLVDKMVANSSKRLGGKIAFYIAAMRATAAYKNQRVKLVLDDRADQTVTMSINCVAVGNGRFFGGGMMMVPRAELDDGQFDVVAIGDATAFQVMKNFFKIYQGTHLSVPYVHSWRATRVSAEPEDPGADVLLDVDGEALGTLPATWSLLPRALPVIVPRG